MKKKTLTRSVCFMLTDQMYKRLLDLTSKREISISDYLRAAIQDRLAKEYPEE